MTTTEYSPRPGDIGLVATGGDVGNLIRLGQYLNGEGFSVYSHAFVYLGRSAAHWPNAIVEAQPSGARVTAFHYGSAAYWCSAISAPLTDAQRQAVCQSAASLAGTPYGWLDYAALVARRFRVPVPGLRSYIDGSRSMICSQLAAASYRKASVPLAHDEWDGYWTPGGLYDRDQEMRRA